MLHRSKKHLGSGGQEYFNEKRPVNLRVDGTAHLAELFPRPGGCWRIPAIAVVLSEWSVTPIQFGCVKCAVTRAKSDRVPGRITGPVHRSAHDHW
jgi:hypothetical protein